MKKIGVLVLWILSYGTEPYARFFDFPSLVFRGIRIWTNDCIRHITRSFTTYISIIQQRIN